MNSHTPYLLALSVCFKDNFPATHITQANTQTHTHSHTLTYTQRLNDSLLAPDSFALLWKKERVAVGNMGIGLYY